MIGIVLISVLIIAVVLFLVLLLANREKRLLSQLYEHERLKQFPAAVETALQLTKIKPRNSTYHVRLAQLYEKSGKKIAAISVYEGMINEKIESASMPKEKILEKLVELLLSNHFYEKAYINAVRLQSINPNNAQAFLALIHVTAGQGLLDEALKLLEQALTLHPQNPKLYYLLALVLFDRGDVRNGTIQLQKSLKLDKNNKQGLYYMAIVYQSMNYTEDAGKICKILGVAPETLPKNIAKTGILKQRMPKLDLTALRSKSDRKNSQNRVVRSMKDFMDSNPESFQDTVLYIVRRMGYTVKREIKDPKIDPHSEMDLVVKSASQTDDSYLEFLRTTMDVGMIHFSEFLHKMELQKTTKGIFITTTKLDPSAQKLVDPSVTVIDQTKLRRYLV